jgi:hypothetical protein
MTFIVTFLIAVSLLIIRSFWKAYKEPAAILGRQAANMNWVAVGQVKDSDGYNNVRYVRDGMEAVVSFQEGNVSLVHPINDTFNDFEELEQSLANLDNEMSNEEALKVYEDLYEESKNDFESRNEEEIEPLFPRSEITVETIKDFDDWDEDDAYYDYLEESYYKEFRKFSKYLDDGESFDGIEELMRINIDIKNKVNKVFLAGFESKFDAYELAVLFYQTLKISIIPKDFNDVNLDKGLEEIDTLALQLNNNPKS